MAAKVGVCPFCASDSIYMLLATPSLRVTILGHEDSIENVEIVTEDGLPRKKSWKPKELYRCAYCQLNFDIPEF